MNLNELYKELKTYKNQRIDFYIANVQKMIKGYLKKVELDNEENPDTLIISMQEVKSDEEILKKYSCKEKKGEKQEKDNRTKIELKDFSNLKTILKKDLHDKITFKIDFQQEEFGIIIYV